MLYLVKNLAKRALSGFNIKFLPLARIRALIRRARFKFYRRAIRTLKFRPTRFKFRRLAIRLFKFQLSLLRCAASCRIRRILAAIGPAF